MITDYAMPGMTGLELANAVRAFRPDVPIILATGYADVPPSEDMGIPRLEKPYRLEGLSAAIAAVMETAGANEIPSPNGRDDMARSGEAPERTAEAATSIPQRRKAEARSC